MEDILSPQDRCDSCGAQAFVQVLFEHGELLFCGHHWNIHTEAATESAYKVIDERYKLDPKHNQSVNREDEQKISVPTQPQE